jgi:hypothetical protein
MFNLLLFLVAYGALFVVRPRLRAWQLAGFFALTVLWINLHSGAVLFVALTGAYALAATFEQRVLGQPPVASEPGAGSLPRLWALFGTLCLAILVSPNGARVLPYVLESGAVNRGLSLEWFGMASAHAFRVHDALSLVCFYGLTVLAAISLGFSPDRVPIARRVVVLAVALLPFLSQRFTWTSFVLVVFVFGSVGSVWLARERIARVAIPACTVLVLILTGVGLTRDLRPETIRERVHPSANFRPGTFPVVAMTFLEEVDLAGNLFNENRWGGYVLFRTQGQYPIFADGRWVTIGVPVVLASREISHRKPGYGELLDRYGIEILLVHRGFATPEVIREQALLPVFENFNAGVYLRPGAAFEENRRRVAAWYEARRIPFDSHTGFDEEQAAAADPRWAKRMHIRRVHVEAFGVDGERARGAKPVKVSGW